MADETIVLITLLVASVGICADERIAFNLVKAWMIITCLQVFWPESSSQLNQLFPLYSIDLLLTGANWQFSASLRILNGISGDLLVFG